MSVQFLKVASLYQGASYAYASVAPAGALVFTAGACPIDRNGETVSPGDVAAQTRQALTNLEETLSAAHVSLGDVAKTTVYVAARDRTDLLAAWAEVHVVFGPHDTPSTLLGVSFLGYSDQLVEIEAIAIRPASD